MSFFSRIKNVFTRPAREVRDLIPELEETLLESDVGFLVTDSLIGELKKKSLKTSDEAYHFLKNEIINIVTPKTVWEPEKSKPWVGFFVGINGTGKTTTIGKLAAKWVGERKKVVVVGADTFRAAAGDQLKAWALKSGAEYRGGEPNSDPSGVIFDGIKYGLSQNADFILVDTAGRLHTKTNLVEELKKMVRVGEKALGRMPDDFFLVLDATTGQNGLQQAKVFLEAIPVSGLVLTKFDGSSKGGVLLSICKETGLPVRLMGLGEKMGDLKVFNSSDFAEKVFN